MSLETQRVKRKQNGTRQKRFRKLTSAELTMAQKGVKCKKKNSSILFVNLCPFLPYFTTKKKFTDIFFLAHFGALWSIFYHLLESFTQKLTKVDK